MEVEADRADGRPKGRVAVRAIGVGGPLSPLLWLHGEEESALRREIGAMRSVGIESFVVEPRPHPDYLGPQWWHDLDIVIDEAKRQGMHLWLFDDSRYPSGFANGLIRDHHPQHLKLFLRQVCLDVRGPGAGRLFRVGAFCQDGEKIEVVVAARRTGPLDEFDAQTLLDLTDRVAGGRLNWDIPEGSWRLFLFVSTRRGGEEETKDYLNPLDPMAVDLYLNLVHEAHYQRYPKEFGSTILGFFTDEPRFGNVASYAALPGKLTMVLPWAQDLMADLDRGFGRPFRRFLPCLWAEGGKPTADVRFTFMDVVSRRFADTFLGRMGTWCRSHGVRLIGHLIEDNGAHARLGYGPGHFFRCMEALDEGGLDYVLGQVLPGFTSGWHRAFGELSHDGGFFFWGPAKLASSATLLDPKKEGRTLCENFGAYGWNVGLRMMKWLTDHVLVRGVNHIVPHAFDPQFPDIDCPPHFYAGGLHPQWRFFWVWSNYARRCCDLLSGGVPVLPVAVVYPAEGEWGGDHLPFEKVVQALAEHQIDCAIVPVDSLVADAIPSDRHPILVVPYQQRLTPAFARWLKRRAEAGRPVWFVGAVPQELYFRPSDEAELLASFASAPFRTFQLDELPVAVREEAAHDVETDRPVPDLRVYRYHRGTTDTVFLTNENPREPVVTSLRLRSAGDLDGYDALADRRMTLRAQTRGGWTEVAVELAPFESLFLVPADDKTKSVSSSHKGEKAVVLPLPPPTALASPEAFPSFELCPPEGPSPDFAGTIRYETVFSVGSGEPVKGRVLDLGEVHETAEVWLNDHPLGVRICPPYRFDLDSAVTPGANRLRVEVTTTFGPRLGGGFFDRSVAQDPSGLSGPVTICFSGGNHDPV